MEQQGKPKSYLSLDASIFDDAELRDNIKLDVQYNRIRFDFPAGFNQLDLLEECRAIQSPDDFDLMYDITMQMLVGKPVVIYMKDLDDNMVEVEKFQVTTRDMNLRGVRFICEFPIVIVWLTQVVSGYLLKKFPLPSRLMPEQKRNEKQKKPRAKK